MVRDVFKINIIGEDLKLSLLTMLNMIKDKGNVPDFMRKALIATIPKKNKSRFHLKNERGIFLVNSLRGILMRIFFNRKSDMIDTNMSDSNIGGRKNKSGINHIWVLTGIIHEQLSSTKNPPIVVQQYDYTQMFDGMHLKEALCDLYDSGVTDDTLNLIYDANKKVQVQVKTPHGLTEEVVLDEVVLQGEVWGPILAANQVDTFGSEMIEEDYSFIFKYKGYIPIPLLGLIDDTISVNLAGCQAAQMNSFINVKSADKYLQFGQEKCKAMVVGRKVENCHIPRLEVDTWVTEHDEGGKLVENFGGKKPMEVLNELTYLGIEICLDGEKKHENNHK